LTDVRVIYSQTFVKGNFWHESDVRVSLISSRKSSASKLHVIRDQHYWISSKERYG